MNKKHTYTLLLLLTCNFLLAQGFKNFVFDSRVQSVKIEPQLEELSSPVISLLEKNKLSISFDYLQTDFIEFRYEIFLCDKNWNKADVLSQEYSNQIGEHFFETMQNSLNTKIQYVHYSTEIPNQNLSFKQSGNYMLMVYDNDSGVLVFQLRFYVIEQLISVEAAINKPMFVDKMYTHQQVDVNIDLHGFKVSDPDRELFLVYSQNNRPDNELRGIKPTFVEINQISYANNPENCFFGGTEFYHFEHKNINVIHNEVSNVTLEQRFYKVILKTDELISNFKKSGDLNGRFLIANEKNYEPHITSDYMYTKFQLNWNTQMLDSMQIYVVGQFNNWMLTDDYKMIYNTENNSFEKTILLKQGYYDYMYAIVYPNSVLFNTYDFSGSFFETANEYEIFVYFYEQISGTDRIIGYSKIKQ